ncbi:hypothetical protein EK904_010988, partial [Melospiza melodia maxima]
MFTKLTKFIANQMDPRKKLDPVESIADHEHFRPLCLLIQKRKSKRIFHSAPYYQWTGFTLDDVLLPGEDSKTIATKEEDPIAITGGTEKKKGTRENKQSIVIPKGCTLAFRIVPLYIRDGKWNMKHFEIEESAGFVPMSGRVELGPGLEEVEICCQIFSELSPDLLLIILNTIKAVMRDKNLLQELSQKTTKACPVRLDWVGTNPLGFKTSATARMFKKLTKFIVNQMDPCKELDPVESIVHNEHFRPLYLLKKKSKPKTVFHRAPYYQRTGFTLDDVLLPGEDGTSIESLHQESSQFTLTKVSADQADGGLNISFDPTNVELKGGASLSKEFSITPQKKSISQQYLEALRKEREINMDHSFIRQLQRTDIRLYVVTETLEASEEAVYKESTKADGGFKAKFYASLCAQSNREDKQSIVIPKGCTLAFRTIPLHIRDGKWDLDYFPAEAVRSQAYIADGPSAGKLGEVRTEVRYSCRIFPELSPDLLLIILNTIKAVMRDENLLQELSQKMEEVLEENDGYELKTESPDLKELFS